KQNFLYEAEKWDCLISPNTYSTNIFRSAFRYNKKMLETGYPRNDYLINKNTTDEINKIKAKLNLPHDKKILLYAPTWRDNRSEEHTSELQSRFDLVCRLLLEKK